MKDPQLKELLRDIVEIYNKDEAYGSLYTPITERLAKSVDSLVAYIKTTY